MAQASEVDEDLSMYVIIVAAVHTYRPVDAVECSAMLSWILLLLIPTRDASASSLPLGLGLDQALNWNLDPSCPAGRILPAHSTAWASPRFAGQMRVSPPPNSPFQGNSLG